MKRANIIFLAALLSVILTGCGTVTDELAGTADNSIETQAVTENSHETHKTTDEESEKNTEAKTESITEEETLNVTEETVETTADTSAATEQKEVFALNGPLGRYQGPDEFSDASFAASFTEEDLVKEDDGTIALNVMIYRYELFSGDEINALKKGDVIWCLGQEVMINTVETKDSGAVVINGGIENGGRVLKTDDGSVYFEAGMNDVKSYYEIGENQYVLSEDFVFTDNSVFGESVTYTAEEFFVLEHGAAGFINSNTNVKTDNNVITEIERVYIP